MKLSQKLLNDDPYHMTHPPRLQGETWRTGGVLTGFLMSNLHETFREASLGLSHPSDTITRCIRNLHVLQDSRRDLEDRWSLDRVSVVQSS